MPSTMSCFSAAPGEGHFTVVRKRYESCMHILHPTQTAYSGPSSIASEGRALAALRMRAQARAGHAASHSSDGSGGVLYRCVRELHVPQWQPLPAPL